MTQQRKVIYTAKARRQLGALYAYIADDSGRRRAEGYLSRIERYCENLAVFPERGTRRDALMPGLRTIGFERRALILFTVYDDRVLIEGVLYGGQDISAAFPKE